MIMRRRFYVAGAASNAAIAEAHLAHIAVLREARVHHRVISQELKIYFDSVAAETIPDQLLSSLDEGRDQGTHPAVDPIQGNHNA